MNTESIITKAVSEKFTDQFFEATVGRNDIRRQNIQDFLARTLRESLEAQREQIRAEVRKHQKAVSPAPNPLGGYGAMRSDGQYLAYQDILDLLSSLTNEAK